MIVTHCMENQLPKKLKVIEPRVINDLNGITENTMNDIIMYIVVTLLLLFSLL